MRSATFTLLATAGWLLCACVAEDAELNPTPDAGVTEDGGTYDSGAAPLGEILVSRPDGTPAASSVVYALNNGRGRLLGRTDDRGRYEVFEPLDEILVRHGFDEVELARFLVPTTTVALVPSPDRPETLGLLGVGMETQLTKAVGVVTSVVPAGERLFAVRQLSRSRTQVVEIDGLTRTERLIHDHREDPPWVFSTQVRFVEPSTLVVFHALFTDIAEEWAARVAVIDLNQGTVLGPSDWTSGSNLRASVFRRGEVLHVVMQAFSVDVGFTDLRFDLAQQTLIEGELQQFLGSSGCVVDVEPPQVFFQDGTQLRAYDVTTSTVVDVALPRLGQYNCLSFWRGPGGHTTMHVEDGDTVVIDERGELLRVPGVWPPGNRGIFASVRAGDSGPFLSTGFLRSQPLQAFLVKPDATPPQLVRLDLESLFGFTPQFLFPVDVDDDRYFTLITTNEGPGTNRYSRLSMNPDGTELDTELLEIDARCTVALAGRISQWPASVRWLECGFDGQASALYQNRERPVRRTFFQGIERFNGLPIEWQGVLLYLIERNDDTEVAFLNPNAPEF